MAFSQRWYRISAVDGRSVASLYGTTEVYGATGLFTTLTSSTPVAAPTTLRQASGSRAGAVTEGIDVSHWQGVIDWTKVHGAGKRFAYIKASDGTSFVDDRYAFVIVSNGSYVPQWTAHSLQDAFVLALDGAP